MPELNPDGTVYEIPPPPEGRKARLQAIANCTRCDSEGYRNTLVCDHVDHAPAALRGKALVQAELDKIRKRRTDQVRGVTE